MLRWRVKSENRTRKTLQLWYAPPWLELLSDKVGGGEDDGGFNIEIPRFEQSVPSAPCKIYISAYNYQNHTKQETARKMSKMSGFLQSLKHGKEVELSRL